MINSLPAAVDIERLVLGYSILRPEYLDSARGSLDDTDFAREDHRRIWHIICALYDAGKPVDRITILNELANRKQLEGVGGIGYIVGLDDGLPEHPQIGGYVDRLHDAALRRGMILRAHQLASRAADETQSADEVLAAFGAVATDLAQATSESRRPISTRDMIQVEGPTALLESRRHRGLKLPWPKLDSDLAGLGPGQLVVLMAATSRGKTSMALQAATHAALQGSTPLIWTMEMSPKSLFQRMMTQLSGVWTGKRQATFEEFDAQRQALASLDERPIWFDRHSRSVASFLASLRQVNAKSKVGLVIVDYLQLIRGTGGARANRAQEVSDNSRALKLAAMDFGVPFLVLSQVDRGSVKGEGKIGLHSAKESGDIENDADVLLWIEGGELSRDSPTTVSLRVGKQREGAAGFGIPMLFQPTTQTFMEVGGNG